MGMFSERNSGFRTKRYGGQKRKMKNMLATVTKVRTMIDRTSEKKFLNLQFGTAQLSVTAGSANPLLYILNPLLQGTSDNTRLGDRVRFSKLQLHVVLQAPASITDTRNVCIRIIQVKEPRGVIPTNLQLYNNATPSPFDHPNFVTIDFPARFKILATKYVHFNPQIGTQTPVINTNFTINLKDMLTDYSIGNAGTIADIDRNALYISVISEGASTMTVTIPYYLWYRDM